MELGLDDPVTVTGGAFDAVPVGDGDNATGIANETGRLQPADMRELVASHPILGCQQPAGGPLLGGMRAVADDILRDPRRKDPSQGRTYVR